MALSSSSRQTEIEEVQTEDRGPWEFLPKVQEAPRGRCYPVCMCKSGAGKDTWPRLSGKEDTQDEAIIKGTKMHKHTAEECS